MSGHKKTYVSVLQNTGQIKNTVFVFNEKIPFLYLTLKMAGKQIFRLNHTYFCAILTFSKFYYISFAQLFQYNFLFSSDF